MPITFYLNVLYALQVQYINNITTVKTFRYRMACRVPIPIVYV